MGQTSDVSPDGDVVREYIFDIQIVECGDEESPEYLVDAPEHTAMYFDSRELAELYVDVYFDVNGFAESGTGERGIPPEIIQGGRDTMAAYFLTQYGDEDYVASFYGETPGKINRYVSWVQERAAEIRERAAKADRA